MNRLKAGALIGGDYRIERLSLNFFVDTNVLLHAANRDVEEHAAAHGALQRWLGGSIP